MYATCVIWLGFIAIYGANSKNISLKVFIDSSRKIQYERLSQSFFVTSVKLSLSAYIISI